MEWDKKAISVLTDMVTKKWTEIGLSHKTDRRNRSAIWNKYLDEMGISLVRQTRYPDHKMSMAIMMQLVLDTINHQNEKVSDAIIIGNPDRRGQFLLVPREVASRILVLGMI